MQDNKKPIRIMLTGGGTGGHLFPLVAVARALRKQAEEENRIFEFSFVGPHTFGEEILAEENIATHYIIAGKLRRYISPRVVEDLFKIPIGKIQSFWHMYSIMPDALFSKGGYGSLSPSLAAWVFRIPIILHESDTSMGLANRIIRVFAKRVILSFPSVYISEKERVLGNPVREELFRTDPDAARRILGLSADRPVLFIQGGSQGSRIINHLTEQALPDLFIRYDVIHQTGRSYRPSMQDANYHPYTFLEEEELAAAYAASSLIVGRAGSGTLFEIAAAHKPSILIPLSSARGDHQRTNAYAYAQGGAAVIMEEPNLSPHLLTAQIAEILGDEEKQRNMSKAAEMFAKPHAADEIAKEVMNVLHL